jgi:hypothetical protein
MKTKLHFFFLLILYFSFSVFNSSAQSPPWLWAKGSTGGFSPEQGVGIAVDANGNSYITGYSNNASITFGSITLTNAGGRDFFIVKHDASGNALWAKRAGGTSYEEGTAIAIDASGNSYVTGHFTGPTITFGSTTLTNANGSNLLTDMFVVKYDVSGNVVWAKRAGGMADDKGAGIAVDANGCYVTGQFFSPSIVFGSTTLTNTNSGGTYSDIFVVKYDASGNAMWAKRAGGIPGSDNADYGKGIGFDANGNIYVTGGFKSSIITYGSDTLINSFSGYADIFIIKYDASGNVVWGKKAGGNRGDEGNSISVDASGNSFITGQFNSPTIIFGSDTLTNVTGSNNIGDAFVARYDVSGNPLWAKSGGGTVTDYGSHVASNSIGDCIVTGYFDGPSITLGSTTINNSSALYCDFFIVKYDVSGNMLWAKGGGGTNYDFANGIAVDANNNSYITGGFITSITFGSTTLTSAGTTFFVAKLAANPVGIEEANNEDGLFIFPNPSSEKFIIEMKGMLKHVQYDIFVYDVIGEKVFEQKSFSEKIEINLSHQPNGIYFVSVRDGENNLVVRKIVKM